ncbi:MAG: hypothetical protein D6798_15520 [Deltaproteobacteria bacterium]|nr:MAG: hypothetical protein D6798_15520 [Deltaproteobacteria bacterium]
MVPTGLAAPLRDRLMPARPPLRPPLGGWARALAHRMGLPEADRIGLMVELPSLGPAGLVAAGALGVDPDALIDGPRGCVDLLFRLPLAHAGVALDAGGVRALSLVVRLAEARVRRWLDPDDAALLHAESNVLLDRQLADPACGPAIRLALAGVRQPLPRRLELHAVLGSDDALASARDAWDAALADARRTCPDVPALRAWLDAMDRGMAHVDGAARFKHLVATCRPHGHPPDDACLDRAVAAAVAFVERPGGGRSTWEVQRWGVGDHEAALVSCWFQEGLLLQALHEAGIDRARRIRALLASLPDELRWYAPLGPDGEPDLREGFWRGIPPDADSLGLMLQLAATCGGLDRDKALGWVLFLRASLGEDGRIPTWFYTAPGGGRSIHGPAWEFASNDCATARTTALTGLLVAELPGTDDIVRANVPIVAASFVAEGAPDDFYYTPAYSELCFLRFARAWLAARPTDPLSPRVAATRDVVVDRIATSQRLDGSWGSPQDTACRLEGLALHGGDPDRLQAGLRFLEESQHPDGSWSAEPFYLMPGKILARIDYHASSELTTGLCVRSIRTAQAKLRSHGLLSPSPHRR